MKTASPFIKRLSLAASALLLVFLTLWLASPALANPDELQIYGGIIQRSVTPGQTIEHTFTVQSSSADSDMTMLVEASGFGQALDGSYQALSAGEDSSPRSAREFIVSIDKPSFTLAPGPSGAEEVTVRIQVPQSIAAGGYYAIIYVHSQPAGDGSVGVVLAANIPVVLTVSSAERVTTGEITGITFDEVEDGKPIKVNTVFQNTGNYHYKARNQVTLSDGAGNQLAEASVSLTGASIIPGYAYQFKASLILSDELEAGEYRVSLEVIGEDGTIRDSKVTTLEIGEDYDPSGGVAETEGEDTPGAGVPLIVWLALALAVLAVVIIVLLIKLVRKA